MLYAKFMYPNDGYDCDVEYAKEIGLKVGEKYEVKDLSMGGSHTSIFLKNIDGIFNSVQFEFYEDDNLVDIYSNSKYNGYIYF